MAEVRAAGAICWRIRPGLPPGTEPNPATMELLMVRSARWGNWSWPKGKLDPGETAPAAAVREVYEETGVRPRLGLPLPGLRYLIGDGRSKQVNYWVGRVSPERVGTPSAGPEEIAEVAWVPADEAVGRLEWPAEAAPAMQLFRLAAVDRLRTTSLLVIRHAKARSRASWPGGEEDRPLTTLGLQQAAGLAPLLDCWAPGTVLTSPWARCGATLQPYTQLSGVHPVPVAALSETGSQDDPELLAAEVRGLVDGGGDTAVCTHRPVLRDVVHVLKQSTTGRARAELPRTNPWLRTAEVLVAHLRPGGGEVIRLERHRPYRYGLFEPPG